MLLRVTPEACNTLIVTINEAYLLFTVSVENREMMPFRPDGHHAVPIVPCSFRLISKVRTSIRQYSLNIDSERIIVGCVL